MHAVQRKIFGALKAAHFNRVIAKPDWSAGIGDAAKTGGPAVDLHIHDTHLIALLAGVPEEVFSTGVREDGTVTYLSTHYLYGTTGPCITSTSGAIAMPARPFVHGFEMYFEKAMLSYSSAGVPLTLFSADGQSQVVKLSGDGDAVTAFTTELQAAVDVIRLGQPLGFLDPQLARNALRLCQSEIESVQTGLAVWVGDE